MVCTCHYGVYIIIFSNFIYILACGCSRHAIMISQQTQDVLPELVNFPCWPNVCDAVQTLSPVFVGMNVMIVKRPDLQICRIPRLSTILYHIISYHDGVSYVMFSRNPCPFSNSMMKIVTQNILSIVAIVSIPSLNHVLSFRTFPSFEAGIVNDISGLHD